ncbi:MAG TPA: alkaline phosphatase D family protein [Thermoleophilaceae bacterium]|nr:alkaline phosphatase D family protein [Thermoleophilaceae bacterium]
MPQLILGPVLRYVDATEATVWVETDAACEVEILGSTQRTFHVAGHHYALVHVTGLDENSVHPYEVHLDGERRWPDPGSELPPSVIRTTGHTGRLKICFGSCRVALPHEPPYTCSKNDDERGREVDALYALARRMVNQEPHEWPDMLLMLGDQVYADEVSLKALEWIRSRRDTSQPPGEEVKDFEEYTRLYWESWGDPWIRWLFANVRTPMIWDDHDVHDDWNISHDWIVEAQRQDWWDERIAGAGMSYWIYQHLGNLSPSHLADDEMYARVRAADDAAPLLHEFALQNDRETEGTRWSYCRDNGAVRLIVLDSRAGRVLDPGARTMVDDEEWEWFLDHVTGDFTHLLIASSLPILLPGGEHGLEAWNEAVCEGAWGERAKGMGEKVRRSLDLEHWAAFRRSFEPFTEVLEEVAAGKRGQAPATITLLSGDVHHAYLAEVAFRSSVGAESVVHQATCSPFRNGLSAGERRMVRFASSRAGQLIGGLLCRSARVPPARIRWQVAEGPWFDNQVATLELDGPAAHFRLEKTRPEDWREATLHDVCERQLR